MSRSRRSWTFSRRQWISTRHSRVTNFSRTPVSPRMHQRLTLALKFWRALKKPRGVDVAIQCAKKNQLDEIWYFYDVAGSVQTGNFIPTNPGMSLNFLPPRPFSIAMMAGTNHTLSADGSKSNCPATGIQYLPKSGSAPSPPTTTSTSSTTTGSGPAPTTSAPSTPGTPFSGKGTLQVSTGGTLTGCIISGGTWYTSGTCAGLYRYRIGRWLHFDV